MTLVGDASSMILLIKANILTSLLENNKMIIPQRVYQEIIKGKEKLREDAFVLERLVKEDKLSVALPDKNIKDNIKSIFGLTGGEQEVIALAYENKYLIITDDKKCLNAAKALEIDFTNSPQIITALYIKKKINKQKAKQALEKLEEFGWYKKDIIKFYKEMIK